MTRRNHGVRELNFDSDVPEPLPYDDELPPSCVRERGYRWQADPKRFDPPTEKKKRHK